LGKKLVLVVHARIGWENLVFGCCCRVIGSYSPLTQRRRCVSPPWSALGQQNIRGCSVHFCVLLTRAEESEGAGHGKTTRNPCENLGILVLWCLQGWLAGSRADSVERGGVNPGCCMAADDSTMTGGKCRLLQGPSFNCFGKSILKSSCRRGWAEAE